MKKLALILFLLFTSHAIAENKFNYIDPTTIPPEFLDEPLKAGSKNLADEVQEIISIQKNVSKEQVTQAEFEAEMRLEIVTMAIKTLNEKDYPQTFSLLNKVGSDCRSVVHQAKDYYKTTRPYLADENIKELITAPPKGNYAYPSGHTACALVLSEVLAQIYPEQRSELKQRAHEIANNRVLGGVHWPHDVKGGQQIGWMIFGALQQSKPFQSDLEKAKSEIK